MNKILFTSLIIGFFLGACNDAKNERKIQNSIAENYSNPPKIKTFTNVEDLINILSDKSSLSFNEWRKSKFIDGSEKWSSNTAIEQFGKRSNNGFQNDIGYVIYGKEKKYCNEVQIVLNIKNKSEFDEALFSLSVWSEQTLDKLKIEVPENLNQAILDGQQFAYENESAYILLHKQNKSEENYNIHPEITLDNRVNYQSWKLIVKSK